MIYLIKAAKKLFPYNFITLDNRRVKGIKCERGHTVGVRFFFGRRTYLFLHPLSSRGAGGIDIGRSEAAD